MGKQFRACWQRKFTCQKTSRWTNSVGESRRSEGLGEWNGQTFYAFCLIKIATARGAAAGAGTADSGARKAAAAAGAGAVAFAGTAFFQLSWRCI